MSHLYYLTDEQRAVRNLAREIARGRISPLAAHVDETGEYPHEQLKLLGQQGLMGLHIPEAYGGSAAGSLAFCLAAEEVAWACASTSTIFLVQNLGGYPIIFAGSEEQKRRYLPKLATGEMTAAFSLSEPGSGSDAAALSCRAQRKDDRYVLNGSKMWVTNGSHAGVITVFVTSDPRKRAKGVTALLVEPGMKGFTVGKSERKLGINGSPTVALHFSDCEVPVENRLGEEGEGFKVAMRTLEQSRPTIGAQAVGIGQAALDASVAYAKERRAFGQPIAAFQGIQFMLADMAIAVHASRLVVHHAAALIDHGVPGTALEASAAKCLASDTAMKAATDAVQILGGYGYTREFPVERFMRDAKITQIYE
ncbi:MAG: acyl-CoA dehydrogenase family protein, partial [Candidatus Rokuibacteriota bacterium]